MSNCSYVAAETSARPSWLGGWFRGTRTRERAAWRVPDLNVFAIGVGQWLTTCIANVCRKKTLSIVRKLCKFCMRTIFVIFNLCNDWRICSIEYSVRFAHTAHVCRWRSKPIRALVKGSATRLLDTIASMCPSMVFVGHGINKCLQGYAPGMHECLRDNIWAIAHMPRWVITS